MAKKEGFSRLTKDVIYGLETDLFQDDVGRALLRTWRYGVTDDLTAAMIHGRADRERLRQAMSGMPYRRAQLERGELVLGLSPEGRQLRMLIQFLNAHSLTIGGSGSGKTTKSRFYVLQIAPHVRGMWLLDLRKREFRTLRPYLARVGVELVVVPARRLRINPLQVPLGVEPPDWIPRAADMLIQVLVLPSRASKLVQRGLFRLYHRFGVFEGRTEYPTLFDLHQDVRTDRDSNPQARLAVLDALEPVLLSLGPEVLAYRYGWPPHELAKRYLAIEFGGLAETDKNLILNYLVVSEFTSRVARGISNPRMDLWICCDEAQRLCSRSRAASGSPSPVEDLIGLVRGTGIGLDLSVLSADDLAPQIVSNTATKFMGRCGSAADYEAAGRHMGLTADQVRWAQLNLNPGLFVGRLGEGAWRHPFVFQVPEMNLVSSETEESAAGAGRPLLDLPSVSASGQGTENRRD